MKVSVSVRIAVLVGSVGLAASAMAQTVKDGPGKDVFVKQCSMCHAADIPTAQQHNRAEWTDVLDKMAENGAQITDADRKTILDYLTQNYGPPADSAAPGAHPAAGTPPKRH